ncbi:MAG: hypothetical protein EOO10_00530 [Chitinophagaceae bacterium]|nr:MAG: hypothetical protein EOO10_00530 [Chitinophagaceae bacterium]
MSVKDFDVNENIERDKNHQNGEDWKSHQKAVDPQAENTKSTNLTEVKNAHATGDGSYGRNDSSLPEDDETAQSGKNSY